MGMADLHVHTVYSDGKADIPELLDWTETETKLDVIAITDHDELEGALRARELAQSRGGRVRVVVGMEVSTLEGHLLCLNLQYPVPSLRSLASTVEVVHAQGGICVVPHPMSWMERSVGQGSLDRIVGLPKAGVVPDGLEVINGRLASFPSFQKISRLNSKRYRMAETGGSDAHNAQDVGRAYTWFEGSTPEDLLRAVKQRTTIAHSTILLRQAARAEFLPKKIALWMPRMLSRGVRRKGP